MDLGNFILDTLTEIPDQNKSLSYMTLQVTNAIFEAVKSRFVFSVISIAPLTDTIYQFSVQVY